MQYKLTSLYLLCHIITKPWRQLQLGDHC